MTAHMHKDHENTEAAESCCTNASNDNLENEKQVKSPHADSTTLDDLKNEILNSINNQHRAPLSWGSATVSVVLVLLAILSVIQTVQSASLYNKLKTGDLKPTTNVPAGGSSTGLPNQVGGC